MKTLFNYIEGLVSFLFAGIGILIIGALITCFSPIIALFAGDLE